MRINLIYARARNGVIGRDSTLPWHLPEDLAHFKRLTSGCPVVMGRKTWDSLPPKFRPLPGRTNLVVTRQADLQAEGAVVVTGLDQALSACARLHPTPADVWVIGGAELYVLALPLAQRAVVTELDLDVDGDAFAPALDASWARTTHETHTAASGLRFAWATYQRKANE